MLDNLIDEELSLQYIDEVMDIQCGLPQENEEEEYKGMMIPYNLEESVDCTLSQDQEWLLGVRDIRDQSRFNDTVFEIRQRYPAISI